MLYNIASIAVITIFALVLIPFHLKAIMSVDWNMVTLNDFTNQIQTVYFWGSVITAFFVCLITGVLYYRFRIDSVKQLQHRQKLACMILENGWYESKQIQSDGFFKDLPSSKTKERISHFPKMYYYLKD